MSAPAPHRPLNQAILASAGTGKTYQLSVRIARLLMLGTKPEQIVALTFTRSAAAEFYGRTLERLMEAADDEKTRASICRDPESPVDAANPLVLDGREATREKFAECLRKLVLHSDRLALSTLDGFFVGLVNQFPLELGLETTKPQTMTDQDVADMLGSTIQRMFTKIRNEGDQMTALRQALTDYNDDNANAGPAEQLVAMAKKHHENFTLSTDESIWGDARHIWPDGLPDGLKLEGDLDDAAAQQTLLAALERYPAAQKTQSTINRGKLVKKFSDYCSVEKTGPDELELINEFLADHGKVLDPKHDKKYKIEYAKKSVELVGPIEVGALRWLAWKFVSLLVRRALKRTAALHKCLQAYEESYDEHYRRKGRLTFADYVHLLGRQIGNGITSNEIAFRLDGRVNHWLLDEFQDTSTAQYEALSHNIDDILSGSPSEPGFDKAKSVFVVGDLKQSLYQWRSGNRELLKRLKHKIEANGQSASLVETRRCSPMVLKMVNELLGGLSGKSGRRDVGVFFSELGAEIWDANFTRQEAHPTAPQHGQAFWARITDKRENDGVDVQAQWIAEDLERCGALGPKLADGQRRLKESLTCAILVSSNDDAADITEWLRNAGVAANDERKATVLRDNPVTAALLAIIETTAHPDNALAKGLAAMSPVARKCQPDGKDGVDWDRLTIEVATRFGAHGAEYTVDWIIGKCLPKQDIPELTPNVFVEKRLRQFRAIAAAYDKTGRRNMVDFVAFCDTSMQRDSADRRSVQVLTIHRSKGLEYDMVYLARLNSSRHKIAQMNGSLLYMTKALEQATGDEGEKHSGIYDEDLFRPKWVLEGISSSVAKHVPGLSKAAIGLTADGAYGSLCKLYVGMTRAKRRLVLLSNALPADKLNACTKDYFEHECNHGSHDFACLLESVLAKRGAAETPEQAAKTEDAGRKGQAGEPEEAPVPIAYEVPWHDGTPVESTDWLKAFEEDMLAKAKNAEEKRAKRKQARQPSTDGSAFEPALRPLRKKPSESADKQPTPWAKSESSASGMELGIHVHGLMAHLDEHKDAASFIRWVEALRTGDTTSDMHRKAISRIKACLGDANIHDLLIRDCQGKTVWVERKAAVLRTEPDGDQVLTVGAFDRVYIEPGKSALIIDYKVVSDRRTSEDLKAHYADQMEAYRESLRLMTKIPKSDIHAKLIILQEKGPSIIEMF